MYIPPITNKYPYKKYERIEGGEIGRLYSTESGNLPSVTTILSATSDNSWIETWHSYVGKQRADDVTNESTAIGTLMHENLEKRLVGDPDHEGGMPIRVLARRLADLIQQNAWGKISEVYGQEVALILPGLWAGTTDLVGVHDGIPTIMDYKNSRRVKTWEDIENYRFQCAAYALAHNEMFGTDIQRGVIFIAVREDPMNPVYQEFVVEGEDFKNATIGWLERVEMFYKIHGDSIK